MLADYLFGSLKSSTPSEQQLCLCCLMVNVLGDEQAKTTGWLELSLDHYTKVVLTGKMAASATILVIFWSFLSFIKMCPMKYFM